MYRGAEYEISFVPKVRLEIVVDDKDAERRGQTLMETAQTGKIGDGKVWVVPVEAALPDPHRRVRPRRVVTGPRYRVDGPVRLGA